MADLWRIIVEKTQHDRMARQESRRLTIVGFVSLIFAYVGSKLVLEIVLQRIG